MMGTCHEMRSSSKFAKYTPNKNIKSIEGGILGQILDFLCFDICYRPMSLVSKMGSFAP